MISACARRGALRAALRLAGRLPAAGSARFAAAMPAAAGGVGGGAGMSEGALMRATVAGIASPQELQAYVGGNLESWKLQENWGELLAAANAVRDRVQQFGELDARRGIRASPEFEAMTNLLVAVVKSPAADADTALRAALAFLRAHGLFGNAAAAIARPVADVARDLLATVREGKARPASLGPMLKIIAAAKVAGINDLGGIEGAARAAAADADVPAALNAIDGLWDMRLLGPVAREYWDRVFAGADTFRNVDVVRAVSLMDRVHAVHADLLKRCAELLTQHAPLFDANQLVDALTAFVSLRRATRPLVLAVVEELKNRVKLLQPLRLRKTLYLCCVARDALFADEVVGLLAAQPDALQNYRTALAVAQAVCCFTIHERKPLLEQLVQSVLAAPDLPETDLTEIASVVESCNTEMGCKIAIPDAFLAKIDAYYAAQPRYPLDALAASLPEPFNLKFTLGGRVGPFYADAVDESARVAVLVREGSALELTTRLMRNLGYEVAIVPRGTIRPARDVSGRGSQLAVTASRRFAARIVSLVMLSYWETLFKLETTPLNSSTIWSLI